MATFYVATTGNDTNLGTIGAPFLTLAKGVSVFKKEISVEPHPFSPLFFKNAAKQFPNASTGTIVHVDPWQRPFIFNNKRNDLVERGKKTFNGNCQ